MVEFNALSQRDCMHFQQNISISLYVKHNNDIVSQVAL